MIYWLYSIHHPNIKCNEIIVNINFQCSNWNRKPSETRKKNFFLTRQKEPNRAFFPFFWNSPYFPIENDTIFFIFFVCFFFCKNLANVVFSNPLVLSQQYFNCFIVEWYFRFHIHILFINYKLWLFFFLSFVIRCVCVCVFCAVLHWKRNLFIEWCFHRKMTLLKRLTKKYVRILPENGKTKNKKNNNKYLTQSTTFHKGIFLLHIVLIQKKGRKMNGFFSPVCGWLIEIKRVYFHFA